MSELLVLSLIYIPLFLDLYGEYNHISSVHLYIYIPLFLDLYEYPWQESDDNIGIYIPLFLDLYSSAKGSH